MHNASGVGVSQRIRQQGNRWQDVRQRRTAECRKIRPIDVLHRVKSARPIVIVKFENARDMRVHQADTQLPLAFQVCD